jgi:hypothetical protein
MTAAKKKPPPPPPPEDATPSAAVSPAAPQPLPPDPSRSLMEMLAQELILQFKNNPGTVPAAVMTVARQLLSDASITLAHVRRGDFGDVAKRVADEFPFDEDGNAIN